MRICSLFSENESPNCVNIYEGYNKLKEISPLLLYADICLWVNGFYTAFD